MIDPEAAVTYAQYREDLILLALFHDVKKGTYIDVGANYPTVDSVTKLFYERGWTGINVEPIKSLHKELQRERPKDINLQCGIGAQTGVGTFREYPAASGHSTFDEKQKAAQSKTLKYTEYEVPVTTLKQVFGEHKPKHVHFLKIDVEGYEYEVVAGNDWKKYRPEVVCIEANHVARDWRKTLEANNYRLFIADGLNEYYVEHSAWKRTEGFDERIIKLDYHALKQHQYQSWSQDSRDLEKLHTIIADQAVAMDAMKESIQSLETLSLKNRSYLSRLKRSAYGLSVDWIKYRRGRSGPKRDG